MFHSSFRFCISEHSTGHWCSLLLASSLKFKAIQHYGWIETLVDLQRSQRIYLYSNSGKDNCNCIHFFIHSFGQFT